MFISVSIALADEIRVRPYTIATSAEEGEPFELCFNLVPNGPGAAWMFGRTPGDLLKFTGPFGAFILERVPERELVFIAEGTAIAPIRPMLRRALAQTASQAVHLLYVADRAEHLLYLTELDSIANWHKRFVFERRVLGSGFYERLIEQVRRRWVIADQDRTRHFFICGIGPGVLKLRDLLRGAGYERRAVHYEQW